MGLSQHAVNAPRHRRGGWTRLRAALAAAATLTSIVIAAPPAQALAFTGVTLSYAENSTSVTGTRLSISFTAATSSTTVRSLSFAVPTNTIVANNATATVTPSGGTAFSNGTLALAGGVVSITAGADFTMDTAGASSITVDGLVIRDAVAWGTTGASPALALTSKDAAGATIDGPTDAGASITFDAANAGAAAKVAAGASNPEHYINAASDGAVTVAASQTNLFANGDVVFGVLVGPNGAASGKFATSDGTAATANLTGMVTDGTSGGPTLADGSVAVHTFVKKSAGNFTAATAGTAATKDTAAPTALTATMDDPVNAANKTTVKVSGTAEAGATVNVSVDDADVNTTAVTGTATGSPTDGTYAVTVDLSTLVDGTVTATVTATDVAGNTGAAATDTSTKDTAAPAAPSVVMDDPVNAGNKAAVKVSGRAEAGATVNVSVADTNTASVTGSVTAATDETWSVTLDLSTLVDGTLTATVTATDSSGNTSAAATATATKDTAAPPAPSVAMQDPVNAANKAAVGLSGAAEQGATVNISVDDADGTTAAVTKQVVASGVNGGYSTTVDLTNLKDGTVTATVTVTDTAGNTGAAATDTSAKDTAAPVAPTVVMDDPVNAANKTTVKVSGTAEAGATVNVRVDDADGNTAAVGGSATVASDGRWSVTLDLATLADGTLTATATATDTAGNTGAAATDTSTKDTAAPVAPTVAMDDPVNAANKTTVKVSGTAEAGATVNVRVDDADGNTAAVGGSATVASGGTWSVTLDLSTLADGTLTATVTATDPAGNTGAAATDTSTKDTVAPHPVSAATSLVATDVVEVTFGEAVNCATVAPGQFTYDVDGTLGGDVAASGLTCAGSVATVTFPAGTVAQTAAADQVRYAESATAAERVKDAAGNDAASPAAVAVTDATAPVLSSATVDAGTLVLTYGEDLDTASVPAAASFTVTADGSARTVNGVTVSAATVTLSLDSAVAYGQAVKLSYTAGSPKIQDTAGNAAADLTEQGVTNLTPAPAPPSPTDSTTEEASAGDTVTTDPAGVGPSSEYPLVASVTTPNAGTVSIAVGPTDSSVDPVDGFGLVGKAVDVTAPAASAATPLTLTFAVDASAIPAGESAETVLVFRNGALVGSCPGATVADPDPCVSARRTTAAGDVEVEVLTSAASRWTFAEPTAACPPDVVPDGGFSDVDAGSTHETSIDCMVWWEVARGVGDGRYAPAGDVTRAQIASFLARAVTASGVTLPAVPADRFTDDTGSPHELAINQLAALGIIDGVTDSQYAPAAAVSREQMASLLVRVHEHVTGQSTGAVTDHFTDDSGSVHEDAINRAADAGLTGGVGAGLFAPRGVVTRAQMASFLANLLDTFVVGDHANPPLR